MDVALHYSILVFQLPSLAILLELNKAWVDVLPFVMIEQHDFHSSESDEDKWICAERESGD